METMISFGSFFWSFIGEKIINSEETPSNDETSLYSMDIAIKMKMYLMIQIIGWVVAYILSFLLMYERSKFNMDIQIDIKSEEGHLFNNKTAADPNSTFSEFFLTDNEENLNYDENYLESGKVLANKKIKGNKNEKKEEKSRKDSLHKKKKEDDSHLGLFDMDLSLKAEDFENDDDEEKEVSLKFLLKFTLKSKRLILFIVILIMQAPVSNMAFSLYREIGEYNKVEPKYLQLVGSLYFIFECLSSFVFGLLCDYFRLKFLLLFINIVGTIVGFTYCLTFKNGLIFFFVQNFLSFSAGGYYPVKDCYLMKVFGTFIYIELNSYVSFLMTFMISLMSPIVYYIETQLEVKDNAYWILFIALGILNLIGTILGLFIDDSQFDYKKAIYKRKKYEEENI
jgi:hypothetical protein